MELDRLMDALETLGELLDERGQRAGVLVVGGGSLLLLGMIERPTADLDVVAGGVAHRRPVDPHSGRLGGFLV